MKKEYIQPKAKEVTVEFHSQMMDNSVNINISSESYDEDDSGIGAKDEFKDFGW